MKETAAVQAFLARKVHHKRPGFEEFPVKFPGEICVEKGAICTASPATQSCFWRIFLFDEKGPPNVGFSHR